MKGFERLALLVQGSLVRVDDAAALLPAVRLTPHAPRRGGVAGAAGGSSRDSGHPHYSPSATAGLGESAKYMGPLQTVV